MTVAAPSIESLVENVQKGARWLGEHDADPPGRFYLWVKMRMTPSSPMPSQPEAVRTAFAQWFHAYNRWLSLYDQLERLSADDAKGAIDGYLEEAR